MTYLARFNSAEVLSSRTKLHKTWLTHETVITKALQSDRKSKTSVEYDAVIRNMVERSDLGTQVNLMIDFFDEIVVCVNKKLCDSATAEAFFATPAAIFFRQFRPYICALRATWNDRSVAALLEQTFNKTEDAKSCGKQ
jgi:hypothetical protein